MHAVTLQADQVSIHTKDLAATNDIVKTQIL